MTDELFNKIVKKNNIYSSILLDRTELINNIHIALISNPFRRVMLFGPAGCGKTTLITQYIQEFRNYYMGFTHISAKLLLPIQNKETNFEAIKELVESNITITLQNNNINSERIFNPPNINRPILIIFDDFDNLSLEVETGILNYLSNFSTTKFSIIISGRSRIVNTIDFHINQYFDTLYSQFTRISIPGLSEVEMFKLVSLLGERSNASNYVIENFINKIASLSLSISSLSPLFIFSLAANYLTNNNMEKALLSTIDQYFPKNSGLAITENKNGILTFPTLDGKPMGLLTPDGSTFPSIPMVVLLNARNLWLTQVEEFEEIIGKEYVSERSIQQFFVRNPHFLQGLDYSKVYSQVVLEREEEGTLIPDFMLRPLGSEYVDILDLKLPNKRVITGGKDRKAFSAAVTSAVAQVREYRDYFENTNYRQKLKDRLGITAFRPKCIVVIGTKPKDIHETTFRQILDDLPHHVNVLTYDALLIRMKEQASKYAC